MLYISPLKALAVDVERNLRAPLAGIANRAAARGDAFHQPAIAIRTGDTPAARARALRARAGRHPDHDAGVALPAAHLERARRAAVGRHGHRRRDPRAGADQARRAPGAVARAARGAWRRRPAAAAHRALGHAASARRSRAVPRRDRASGSRAAAVRRPAAGPCQPGRAPPGPRPRKRPARRAIHDEFGDASATVAPVYRPVTIVDAAARKKLDLHDRSAGRGHGAAGRRSRRSRADRRRRAPRGSRSGRRSTRGCWSWSGRTARR